MRAISSRMDERHAGDRLGVVGSRSRDAARHHVRIADGLDLLQALGVGQRVEGREDLVEQPDDLSRSMLADRSVNPTMSANRTVT